MAGTSGTAGGGTSGGKSGANEGGNGGEVEAQAGEGGTAGDAGSGGTAGDSAVEIELEIAQPTLAAGETYVAFTGTITARGAEHYTWRITSGTLPAGLNLQGTQSATVTIEGTPTEAGQFQLSFSVTDGSTTKAVDVKLVITHSALFLSDRNLAGVNELFITEIGSESAAAPQQLNPSIPSGGGISSYAWSPDGSKVLYVAKQSSGGAAELWVTSLASPGTAQRVSAPGVTVSRTIWLGLGNVAAYSTSAGDTYLADLSTTPPGPSRLVITGHGSPAFLLASPNGTSLVVSLPNDSLHAAEISYATWTSAGPKVVPLFAAQGMVDSFSYDGRYAVVPDGPRAKWVDLSIAAPVGNDIDSANGVAISWSPKTGALLVVTGVGPSNYFSRGDFTPTGLTVTALASGNSCGAAPVRWSPDGNNGLFGCAGDIRGIKNLAAAVAGKDFSLLPTGFLTHAFTDTPSVGWSPDSKWVALRADRDVDGQYDLHLIRWSAPGTAHKPYTSSLGSGVTAWTFAQNSQSVAFVGTVSPQANAGLYLTKLPTSGALPTATLVSASSNSVAQTDITWLPGSRVIAYRAVVSGAAQLFAVPVSADGSPGSLVSISGASGSGVTSYQLAPTR